MIVRACVVVAALLLTACAGDQSGGADGDVRATEPAPVMDRDSTTTSEAPDDATDDDGSSDAEQPGSERLGVSERIIISVVDEAGGAAAPR